MGACVARGRLTTELLLWVTSSPSLVLGFNTSGLDGNLDLGRGTGRTMTSVWFPSVKAGCQRQTKSLGLSPALTSSNQRCQPGSVFTRNASGSS